MSNYFLVVPILSSLFISLFFIPYWIKKAKQIGLMWNEMNKIDSPKVAGSGGIIAVLSFIAGVFIFIAYSTFYLRVQEFTVEIFALASVSMMLFSIGLIDDLLGWQKGGLSRRSRLVLVALAAVPLVVINAGKSQISLPFWGMMDFGLLYPLAIIPLGILGAATTFNFLAGFNGLEAGQGILLLSALGIVAFFTGNVWLSVIAACMVAALIGFLFYNFYPAKVFPGDSLTYTVGGLIAIIPILGNFEKIAVFFFIPYIIEFMLKSRGKLVKYSFGKPNKEGHLELNYNKFYSLNHIAIYLLNKSGFMATEKRVVYSIWIFQAIIILIGFAIFGEGMFA